MAWDDKPPTKSELKVKRDSSWDSAPPSPLELEPSDAGSGESIEALLQQIGDKSSLGYAPQLSAAVGSILPDPSAGVDEELKKQGFNISQPESDYVSLRDADIKRQLGLQERNPIASGIGSGIGLISGGLAGGSALGAAVPALKIAKGSGLISNIAKSAGQGAITSGAYNPGDVEGEISPLQVRDRAQAAAMGGVVGGAVPGVMALPGLAKKGLTSAASKLSGLAKHDIETYAKHTDEINRIIKESGGNLAEMADNVRGEISGGIQKYRQGLNEAIGKELQAAPKDAALSAKPMLSSLKDSLDKVDKDLNPEQHKYISELIQKIGAKTNEAGNINLQDAHKLTEFLQGEAKYNPGGIFPKGDQYAKAAKAAAAKGREIRNLGSEKIGGEVKKGYQALSQLHDIEKNINKNLISPGKADAALFSAASGANPRNAKVLQELSDLTGVDAMGKARLASAARTFGSPDLIPSPNNGAALARLAVGGAAGGLLGASSGEGHSKSGSALGAAAASPLTVKAGINAANLAGKLIPDMGGLSSATGKIASPAAAGIGVGAAMSKGFTPDPFVMLSKSPDSIKQAVDNGAIPAEAVRAVVSKSGELTREDYIKAQRLLKSAQGRQALQAAMYHVSNVGNPEQALGPGHEAAQQKAVIQGGNNVRR